MDIRLANTSQASIVVLFVPNANECHATKKFIQKLFLKELVAGEESKENRLPSQKRKKGKHKERHGISWLTWRKSMLILLHKNTY